jgi:hypothetical protein
LSYTPLPFRRRTRCAAVWWTFRATVSSRQWTCRAGASSVWLISRRHQRLGAGGSLFTMTYYGSQRRELAPPLQCDPATCIARLSRSRPRGLCSGACRVAGCATSISCAGHASVAHHLKHELTLNHTRSSALGFASIGHTRSSVLCHTRPFMGLVPSGASRSAARPTDRSTRSLRADAPDRQCPAARGRCG